MDDEEFEAGYPPLAGEDSVGMLRRLQELPTPVPALWLSAFHRLAAIEQAETEMAGVRLAVILGTHVTALGKGAPLEMELQRRAAWFEDQARRSPRAPLTSPTRGALGSLYDDVVQGRWRP